MMSQCLLPCLISCLLLTTGVLPRYLPLPTTPNPLPPGHWFLLISEDTLPTHNFSPNTLPAWTPVLGLLSSLSLDDLFTVAGSPHEGVPLGEYVLETTTGTGCQVLIHSATGDRYKKFPPPGYVPGHYLDLQTCGYTYKWGQLAAPDQSQARDDLPAAGRAETTEWNYDNPGPAAWAEQYPNCGGESQSPINLLNPEYKDSSTVLEMGLDFSNYSMVTTSNTELFNNGHTMGLEFMTPYTAILTGGPLATSYQLLQLHMHWGEDDTMGSEHAVDGELFPMEMHLVHKMETATSPLDIKDGLAVTGFMFKISETANPAMAPIIDSLQAIREYKTFTTIQDESFSLSSLIEPAISGPYFSYSGSLTTPPCSEVVQWMVFQDTLAISSAQMAEFRTLLDHHGSPIVNNFRPLQEIGARGLSFGSGAEMRDTLVDVEGTENTY